MPSTRLQLEHGVRAGFSLLELSVALVILALVALSFTATLARGIDHTRDSYQTYRVVSILRGKIAEIQDIANQQQDLGLQLGIAALFDRYDGKTLAEPQLPGCTVSTTCFADEATVPDSLGGPQDLNFDGDADDDLSAVGTDLKLVPMRLTANYTEDGDSRSITIERLFVRTKR